MIVENIITAIQYSGYFQSEIKKILESGKINPVTEEMRIQRILEEERKKVQPVYENKGKTIDIII